METNDLGRIVVRNPEFIRAIKHEERKNDENQKTNRSYAKLIAEPRLDYNLLNKKYPQHYTIGVHYKDNGTLDLRFFLKSSYSEKQLKQISNKIKNLLNKKTGTQETKELSRDLSPYQKLLKSGISSNEADEEYSNNRIKIGPSDAKYLIEFNVAHTKNLVQNLSQWSGFNETLTEYLSEINSENITKQKS